MLLFWAMASEAAASAVIAATASILEGVLGYGAVGERGKVGRLGGE